MTCYRQKKPPKIPDEPPSIKRENDGRTLAMEFKVQSDEKPQVIWMFNGKPIKSSGRFFIDVARDGDYYLPVLEVDDVIIFNLFCIKIQVKLSFHLLDIKKLVATFEF